MDPVKTLYWPEIRNKIRPFNSQTAGMAISEEQVRAAIQTYIDPATGKDYVAGKEARNIRIDGNDVSLEIVLGYPARSVIEGARRELTERVGKIAGVGKVRVDVEVKIVPHAVQRGLKLLGGVKNVIAVASGKGGVGKSTTAVNLALALAAEGAKVGILDADIYGPSQQVMMGLSGKPMSPDGKTIEPMVNYGVQAMSIGLLIDVDTPMVWRGPMVTQALEQLLRDTQWKDLDYLVVDRPHLLELRPRGARLRRGRRRADEQGL
jgi:ATP-binding protein involved in chromosome partitioning